MDGADVEVVDPDEDTSPGRCTCSSCTRRDELFAQADALRLRLTSVRAPNCPPHIYAFTAMIFGTDDALLATAIAADEIEAMYLALRAIGAVS